ncbi:MAG: T9SS type A sorting domain-containing protein [Bacteroidales bacterium]|jgi:hypothetical protein
MRKISNITFRFIALSLWIILSSWGSVGHRIINQHAPASFPSGMNFLKASWTAILADNASVADDRKAWDNTEPPKHYIDIDNYDEFILYGKIPMTEDSVKNIYGITFLMDNGIIPWATIAAFDSVKACFQRNDFNKASLFAADLGHYIGDGHQPLHITRNYDGQYTSQDGVHSRYETHMIGLYSFNIIYSDDTAQFIEDVPGFIFTYLYHDYLYKDSVLLADVYATSVAGNTSSTAYYQALWNHTGAFTIALFKNASWSLASLIYTAWVEAGKPDEVPQLVIDPSILGQNNPNPVNNITSIPIEIKGNNDRVTLKVFDSGGKLITTIVDGKMKIGKHAIIIDASGYCSGIYFYTLQSGDAMMTRKMVVMH